VLGSRGYLGTFQGLALSGITILEGLTSIKMFRVKF